MKLSEDFLRVLGKAAAGWGVQPSKELETVLWETLDPTWMS